jgi:hypothetical protein
MGIPYGTGQLLVAMILLAAKQGREEEAEEGVDDEV